MKTRCFLIPEKPIAVPEILQVGCADDENTARYGPARRTYYILHFILRGHGVFNGHPLGAGQGFLITPGMAEEYHADPADPWFLLWFVTADERMRPLLPLFGADPETGIFSFSCLPEMEAIRDGILAAGQADGYLLTGLFARMMLAMEKARAAAPAGRSEKPTDADLYVVFAENYIDAHPGEKITVRGLCDLLGISQPYLCVSFPSAPGCPRKNIWRKNGFRSPQNCCAKAIFPSAPSGGRRDTTTCWSSPAFSNPAPVSPPSPSGRGAKRRAQETFCKKFPAPFKNF